MRFRTGAAARPSIIDFGPANPTAQRLPVTYLDGPYAGQQQGWAFVSSSAPAPDYRCSAEGCDWRAAWLVTIEGMPAVPACDRHGGVLLVRREAETGRLARLTPWDGKELPHG